jgi:hypothetical protein
MLSLYSHVDKSVNHQATIIPGVAERALPSLRHGRAIIYGITLGAPGLIRFLKQSVAED